MRHTILETMILLFAALTDSAVASQLPEGGRTAFVAGKWTDFQLIGQGATAIYSAPISEDIYGPIMAPEQE